MNNKTKALIKFAESIEAKYSFIKNATSTEEIKNLIERAANTGNIPYINGTSFINSLRNDGLSINITLAYETGWSTWLTGAKIILNQFEFSPEPSREVLDKYKGISQNILRFVNTKDLRIEGGPWSFVLP